MSLLSGIKFISKKDRDTSSSKNDPEEHARGDDETKRKRRDSPSMPSKRKNDSVSRMGWMVPADNGELCSRQSELLRKNVALNNSKSFDTVLSLTKLKCTENEARRKNEPLVNETLSILPVPVDLMIDSSLSRNLNAAALLRSKLKSSRIIEVTSPFKDDLTLNTSKMQECPLEQKVTTITSHLIRGVRSSNESSLKSLVLSERRGVIDMDAVAARTIIRMGNRFKGASGSSKRNEDAEDDEGDTLAAIYDDRRSNEALQRNDVIRAIKADERLVAAMKHCQYCSHNNKATHIIARGLYTSLRLKAPEERLHRLHCEIVPTNHSFSFRQCEEEVVAEVVRFKSCLRRLCESELWMDSKSGRQGDWDAGSASVGAVKCCMVFVETAIQFSKMRHATVDCVPFELNREREVTAVFKEALLEVSGGAPLIQLSSSRPLHRAIPSSVEYISVEWGDLDDGSYAGMTHVLRDEEGHGDAAVEQWFCLDILGGMSGEDPTRIRRKRPLPCSTDETKIIRAFCDLWSKHDWTRFIDLAP